MKDKVLKILCYECKGTGYRNGFCCSIECPVCHGKRVTEYEPKAEDLSTLQQQRIAFQFIKELIEFCGANVQLNQVDELFAIEDWQGLKGGSDG